MARSQLQQIQLQGVVKYSLAKDQSGQPTILDLSFKKAHASKEEMESLIPIAQKQYPPIKTLIIASSSLKSVPAGINQLRGLKHISISGNYIKTISPRDLPNTLTHLNLSGNPIPMH